MLPGKEGDAMIRGVDSSGIASSVCLLGVASAHGDDALGWTLLRDWPPAENLSLRPGIVTVHLLRNPLQILDHLDPRTHAVIVDACLATTSNTNNNAPRAEALVLSWPDPAFSRSRRQPLPRP